MSRQATFPTTLLSVGTLLLVPCLSRCFAQNATFAASPSSGCNGGNYGESDPYAGYVTSVLIDLAEKTPNMTNYIYHNNVGTAFGLAKCIQPISYGDCGDCLADAANYLTTQCNDGINTGGAIMGTNCTMFYGNSSI